MYLILWCLSLVTDGLRPEVGYISDVEVQEDPSLQMAWIWLKKVIGEDVMLCIPQRFGPRCFEVSLECEFGDDTSRRSTVQIRNAHLGLAKHGQVVMFAPFFFQRTLIWGMRRPILRSSGEDGRVHNESSTGLHGTCGSRSLCRALRSCNTFLRFNKKTSFSDAKEIREKHVSGLHAKHLYKQGEKHESNAEKWFKNGNWGESLQQKRIFFPDDFLYPNFFLLPFNGGRRLRGHPQLELWKRCLQGSGSRCGDVAGP